MIPSVPSRLYLVDGMSHIYRAFYAIKGLTDRSGRPTNAVFGFTNMLRKLIAEEDPEFLGVAIDLPGPTIRHQQFEDYKATRRPTPPDLLDQVPLVLDVCRVLEIPVLSLQRYEADDVIGTVAAKAVESGLDVVVVTIDKDMFQLVSERVSILDPRDMKLLGPSEVGGKFGVEPHQIVDVLSLAGDSSDNIPGAPGIGSKGAQKLIQKYGSLDELLRHRSEVRHKTYRTSLQDNEDQILQSRDLVTIHRDLPIPLDLEELRLSEPDREAARELFAKLNFLSLLDEFIPAGTGREAAYKRLESLDALRSLRQQIKGEKLSLFPFIEESSKDGRLLSGLGFSMSEWTGWSVSSRLLMSHTGSVFEILAAAGEWIAHDLKPLLGWLRDREIEPPSQLSDTMLMVYLLSPHRKDFSLEKSCLEHLHYRFSDTEDQKSLFSAPDGEELAERADLTRQLAFQLIPDLLTQGLGTVLEKIEIPLIEVLVSMEKRGVMIDAELLSGMSVQTGEEIDRLSRRIYDLAGAEFNINSPRQLASVLFEKLELPVVKRTRKAGHYATGAEVLEKLAQDHEIAALILQYRELAKLKNTYLDALPRLIDRRTGRVHTSFNQMVAATGRLSSSNPNLQNIPVRTELGRAIRKAFIAPPGFSILTADYSQLELRIMAHLSGDTTLRQAFLGGEDIHSQTALEVFGPEVENDPQSYRRKAKVINFGIMYGLSAFGLANTLKIERREAQQFIDQYFARYEGVRNWIENTLSQARDSGLVRTLLGRIRPIPEIHSRNWNLRHFGERAAINAPIQGTGADLIKMAMIDIHVKLRRQPFSSSLILQVHDELVLEVANSELEEVRELVRRAMESATVLDVPLEVETGVGESWYEAK